MSDEHPLGFTCEDVDDRVGDLEARVAELTTQRDNLLQRLAADPGRAAIAAVDGLRKLLSEDEELGRLLDWVGVAAMDSLSERLLFLCAEYLSRTGQVSDVEVALALGRDVLSAAENGHPETSA
jgi:hypothetical protein